MHSSGESERYLLRPPQVALLFMPSFGDNVRVVGDLSIYDQLFLLSLTDHGLAGILQTALGSFAPIIRRVLHVSEELVR